MDISAPVRLTDRRNEANLDCASTVRACSRGWHRSSYRIGYEDRPFFDSRVGIWHVRRVVSSFFPRLESRPWSKRHTKTWRRAAS